MAESTRNSVSALEMEDGRLGRDSRRFWKKIMPMKKLYYTTISAPFTYEIPKIKGSRFF
jgi:hypothetical protein